ncbi:Gas vesicle protein K [Halalkalicoccus paucihalophilus]|uniref:Gas vesicle protein K n=1 Tax=Halalkalicoccus paucihalophilus TaxID=1008153 RepID=A0A151AE56_9EURY|nr:gas vesicle protein K [Halalkalicoccus paucihalophilus]KYH25850.1 Gas vesicle protein K [Halalkalicoccus paucihalophilus]
MRQIDLGGEADEGGETDAASGLLALVMTVVELLVEAMEKEAIRRMESGVLGSEEIERLGTQLQAIEAEIEAIKEREGIENEVGELRTELNDLLSEGIEQVYDDHYEELEDE